MHQISCYYSGQGKQGAKSMGRFLPPGLKLYGQAR